jgi:hypothetical protein
MLILLRMNIIKQCDTVLWYFAKFYSSAELQWCGIAWTPQNDQKTTTGKYQCTLVQYRKKIQYQIENTKYLP